MRRRLRAVDWRFVLLGDWTPIVRDPVDLLRLALVAGAIALMIIGDIGQAARLLVTVVATLIPRLLNLARPFDLAYILGMSLQAWGNVFGLFEAYGWYDTVVHFIFTMLAAPVGYIALVRLEVLPDLSGQTHAHQRLGIVLVTFFLGAGLEALYEIYEYSADHVLGTRLQAGNADTVTDLAASGAGALVGGWLLAVWARYGWTTVRRAPAARVHVSRRR